MVTIKKGIELNQAFGAVLVVVLLGVLVIIAITIFSNLSTSFNTDTASSSETILVESSSVLSPVGFGITSSEVNANNLTWLEFDGVNDKIDISERFCNGDTDNISISAWINVRNWTSTTRFVSRLCGEGVARTPYLGFNNSGHITFRIRNNSEASIEAVVPELKTLNTWYHVVGVYNSTNVIIYLDSVLEDVSSITGPVKNGTAKPIFGNSGDSGDLFYDGSLDEIRIYNRSLSQLEVTDIYNSGRQADSSLPSNDLVGWYSFDENSGTTVHDKSGNGNDGV